MSPYIFWILIFNSIFHLLPNTFTTLASILMEPISAAIESGRPEQPSNRLPTVKEIMNATLPANITRLPYNWLPGWRNDIDAADKRYYDMKIYGKNQSALFTQLYVNFTSSNGDECVGTKHAAKYFSEPIKLPFRFPFYGQYVENVSISSGGFLSVDDSIFSWLLSAQYVAPLMMDFDIAENNDAQIRYILCKNERAVFEWSKMALRENQSAGLFSFQVSLWANGDITIVYEDIPISLAEINEAFYSCKIGIQHAYLFYASDDDESTPPSPFLFAYPAVHVPKEFIQPRTVVHLTALPNCLKYNDCGSCYRYPDQETPFECHWCGRPNSSDHYCFDQNGLHLHQQEIFERNGCDSPCSPAANQDAAILDAYWERMQEIAKTNYSYVDGES